MHQERRASRQFVRRIDYARLQEGRQLVFWTTRPHHLQHLQDLPGDEIEQKDSKPYLAYIWQLIKAGFLAAPSVIIAATGGTKSAPAPLNITCSASANIPMNLVHDSAKAKKNGRIALRRLNELHRIIKYYAISDAVIGVLICAIGTGGLTSDSYHENFSDDIGPWVCLFLATLAANYQRANGAVGFGANCSPKDLKSKWQSGILDKLDLFVSLIHFLIGIPIWLDMYTPKAYSGLNKSINFISFGYLNNLICDVKDCQVSTPSFVFFAYAAKWNAIFFSWATRNSITTMRNFCKFFLDSDFAQGLSKTKFYGFFLLSFLLMSALGVVSYFSAHGLEDANLKGRAQDPADFNVWIFDANTQRIGVLGYAFFTLVNWVPMLTAIPVSLAAFGFFINSRAIIDEEKAIPMQPIAQNGHAQVQEEEDDDEESCSTTVWASLSSFFRTVREKCCGSRPSDERTPLTNVGHRSQHHLLSPGPATVLR